MSAPEKEPVCIHEIRSHAAFLRDGDKAAHLWAVPRIDARDVEKYIDTLTASLTAAHQRIAALEGELLKMREPVDVPDDSYPVDAWAEIDAAIARTTREGGV